MLLPPVARTSQPMSKGGSDDESDGGGGSSSEVEAESDDLAAPVWLELLLPLPLSCSVVPVQLPFPPSMNSRVLTASPSTE